MCDLTRFNGVKISKVDCSMLDDIHMTRVIYNVIGDVTRHLLTDLPKWNVLLFVLEWLV